MGAGVPRPGPYKSFAPRQLRPPDHPAAAGAELSLGAAPPPLKPGIGSYMVRSSRATGP
jgi:hypothetical protein